MHMHAHTNTHTHTKIYEVHFTRSVKSIYKKQNKLVEGGATLDPFLILILVSLHIDKMCFKMAFFTKVFFPFLLQSFLVKICIQLHHGSL